MRGKPSKSLRWGTAGFVVTVALLLGLEFADRFVPLKWRTGTSGSTYYLMRYYDARRSGVAQAIEATLGYDDRSGVAVGFWVQVKELEPIVVDILTPENYSDPRRRSRADAEDDLLKGAANWLTVPADYVPLLKRALASPGQRVSTDYAERRWVAALMEFRSRIRFSPSTAGIWAPILAVWAGFLLVRWRSVFPLRRAGECVKCGYDRSGIAADAVCPECGKQA